MGNTRPAYIVFVELAGFYAACETAAAGCRNTAPLAVMRGGICVDVSREAYRRGVRPGLTRRQAALACADIVFSDYCEPRYVAPGRRFLQALNRLSPAVEPVDYHRAFVELPESSDPAAAAIQAVRSITRDIEGLAFLVFAGTGMSKLVSRAAALCLAEEAWGGRTGYSRAGVASAGAAAVGAPPADAASSASAMDDGAAALRALFVDDEQAFLENLPVRFLWKLPEEARLKMEALGLRTVGDAAAIPLSDLLLQFGQLGYVIQDLCRGVDNDPVRDHRPLPAIVRRVSFEGGTASIAILEDAVEAACRRIGCELRNAGSGAGRMCVEVIFDNGGRLSSSRRFLHPKDSSRSLATAARACLADMGIACRGAAGLDATGVRAEPAGEFESARIEEILVSVDELGRPKQGQMLLAACAAPDGDAAAARSAEALERAIASLGRRYEKGAVVKGSEFKPSRREIVLSLWDPIRSKSGWTR